MLCLPLWLESVRQNSPCGGCWTENKQPDTKDWNLYLKPNPTHFKKGFGQECPQTLKTGDVQAEHHAGGCSHARLCSIQYLRILLQRHPQRGAHFHPTGWDFFLFFPHFVVLLSHHCVLMSAKLGCSSCCLLSLLCCCAVNFDAVFSQRHFLPSQKADAQNAEMDMVSCLYGSEVLFLNFIYICSRTTRQFHRHNNQQPQQVFHPLCYVQYV